MGGTIASRQLETGGVGPAIGAEELAAGIGTRSVEAVDLSRLPSSELSLGDMVGLASAVKAGAGAGLVGLVVTHGTDTMEETAFALDLLVECEAPVAVTGALRHPGLPGADGPANVAAAAALVGSAAARHLGSVVVMNDEVHAARWARKAHTSRPSAFTSAPVGPLGWVSEGAAHIALRPVPFVRPHWLGELVPEGDWAGIRRDPPVRPADLLARRDTVEPTVGVVVASVGDPGDWLRDAARHWDGLVVEGLGGGHVPPAWVGPLAELVGRIPVVLSSRTGAGQVLSATYGFPGSERDLLARGVCSAGALSGPKARLAVAVALWAGRPRGEIEAFVGSLGRP